MFTADLFMIMKTWKKLGCPSVGEWIHKLILPILVMTASLTLPPLSIFRFLRLLTMEIWD
jgi:hypothetical protein